MNFEINNNSPYIKKLEKELSDAKTLTGKLITTSNVNANINNNVNLLNTFIFSS